MQYYHNLITAESFDLLQKLRAEFPFMLIGGWAVFFYTRALKSKDIDIIITYEELTRLKERFAVAKNDRLKKYEVKFEHVDIDIYLPYYSELGIPAEIIQTKTIAREGFKVPRLELLLLLKQWAYLARQGTAKGEKDRLDIISLIALPEFDWPTYLKFAAEYNRTELIGQLQSLVKQTTEAPELNLNQNSMAKLKKNILPQLAK